MNRVAVFVDGFNLYHALQADPHYYKYKWLDLRKLSKCFVTSKENIDDVFYFSAYVTWDAAKLFRHQLYVKALQSVGIIPVFGAFRMKDTICRICHRSYRIPEEKQTDVNIAIWLFQTAVKDTWDTALIVSGDSDLIPAIKAVKNTFPGKRIGVAIPIGRRAEELKNAVDFHIKIKSKHLATCQFEDSIKINDHILLKRPDNWG